MGIGQALLCGATALTLALGLAHGAGSQSKDQDPGFNALDKNYDGYLSSAEAVAKKDFRAAQDKLSHIFGSMQSNSSAGSSGSARR